MRDPFLTNPRRVARRELRGLDLVMEFVTDGTDLYIRAPFLAALAELDGAEDPTMDVFTQLGDGWGNVDGTAVPGVDAGPLTGMLGIGGADPAACSSCCPKSKVPSRSGRPTSAESAPPACAPR